MMKRNASARALSSVLFLSMSTSLFNSVMIFGVGKVGSAVPSSENELSMKCSGLKGLNSFIDLRSSGQCAALTKSLLLAVAAASKLLLLGESVGWVPSGSLTLTLMANNFATSALA